VARFLFGERLPRAFLLSQKEAKALFRAKLAILARTVVLSIPADQQHKLY